MAATRVKAGRSGEIVAEVRGVRGGWCNRGGVGGHLPGVESRARFEALYRANAGAVRAYARRRTDSATADDVVADVFLTAWRRLADVPSDPLPWLLGIARRILANRRRGEARAAALRDRLATSASPQASDDRPGVWIDEKVHDALRALSERDREILLLVAWDGLEPARAARALGVRPGAFAVRLHRARRRLVKLLADPGEDDSEKRPAAAEVS
jgi:RNA polymerase sigma-70 factor, ECF subfamily